MSKVLAAVVAVALLVSGVTALAQIPTGTLTGRAINEGQGLPGVTVTAKSPALQGDRVAVTGASGGYVMVNLPPGEYKVTFTISGFQTVVKNVKISAAQQNTMDATLSLTQISSEVTVVAGAEAISQSTVESTTYTQALLTTLPTGRSINSAVTLAPGLNANGPNGYSVAGAQSTENLYMVNGVMIGDNIRNTPNNLFIEDAIQETTTTTSSVSAEYGRFVGGVINTITKSGGNQFSGSLRANLANDSWSATNAYRTSTGANPQEGVFIDKITPTWEATFGGPILKDKVWFFLAGRYYDTIGSTTATTTYTAIPYPTGNKEPRYEAKLTLTPVQNHTLTGSYLNVKTTQANNWYTSAAIMDLASLYDRVLPQDLLAINYNGVLSDSFFLSAQYSKRKFTFENSGSIYTDVIKGTLLLDRSRGNARFNSPTFCGVCTPEERNNDDILVKGTYFLSSKDLGSHSIVVGYDNFSGQRVSNNHQSGSDYRIYGTGSIFNSDGTVAPIWNTGTSTFFYYQPITADSQGSNLRTQSVFVNDTWRLSNYLSFNLGVRYDVNDAKDAGGLVTSTDKAFSPRLAATWDLKGNGKMRVTASYAQYVAAIQEGQAGSGYTPNGNPATYYWYYDGFGATPINTGATGPYLTSSQALTQFFNWFAAGGCYDPANKLKPTTTDCKITQAGAPSLPGVNRQINGSLASPTANEYTIGFAGTIGTRGSFRADVVRRTFGDVYDLRIDMSTGKVKNANGQTFDLGLIENSNDYRREYTGLHTQFQYRFGNNFNFGANWTWSHLIGDYVGENSTSGTIVANLHNQPEYFDRAWNSPVGSLPSDQRHRVRLYGTYDIPLASAGLVQLGLIQAWDTGTPYGAAGSVGTRNYVKDPGYSATPATVTYYFTARDAFRYEDVWRTDLSLTYSFRLANTVELYINPVVYNVFNAQHIVSVNQTVNTAANSSTNYAVFNPFTDRPNECPQTTTASACKALGGNWQKGALFGQPTGPTSYQAARSFTLAVGLRF